jgi:ribosomal protein S18 acetylase RimI-like enzyme
MTDYSGLACESLDQVVVSKSLNHQITNDDATNDSAKLTGMEPVMSEDATLSLERVQPGPEREDFVPLLLLADAEAQVRDYLHHGDLYALRGADGGALGVTLVLSDPAAPGTAELRAVAIDPAQHNRGLGRQMLASVLADLRARGFRRSVVGTSNAGIGQIAFYQKAGFRVWRIERDYFIPQKGYDPEERENDLPHRDMIWFDLDLA